MAKVLRSDVKHDGEVIPAGTRMSSKDIPTALRKQLKDYGFFVDEAEEDSDAEAQEEEDEVEEEVQDEEKG